MLEYGSGASTAFFSEFVDEWVNMCDMYVTLWHVWDMCDICVICVWHVYDIVTRVTFVTQVWTSIKYVLCAMAEVLGCYVFLRCSHFILCQLFHILMIQHCAAAQCAVLHNAQCMTAQCNVQCTTMHGCWIMHYVAAFRTELKSCVRKDVMWPNLTFKVSVEHHKDWEERVRLMVCFSIN